MEKNKFFKIALIIIVFVITSVAVSYFINNVSKPRGAYFDCYPVEGSAQNLGDKLYANNNSLVNEGTASCYNPNEDIIPISFVCNPLTWEQKEPVFLIGVDALDIPTFEGSGPSDPSQRQYLKQARVMCGGGKSQAIIHAICCKKTT